MRNRAATWVQPDFRQHRRGRCLLQVYLIASYIWVRARTRSTRTDSPAASSSTAPRCSSSCPALVAFWGQLEVDRLLLRALAPRDDPDLPRPPTRIRAAAGCTGCMGCSRCSCSCSPPTSRYRDLRWLGLMRPGEPTWLRPRAAAATAGSPLATFDAVADLPLEVESFALERLEQAVSPRVHASHHRRAPARRRRGGRRRGRHVRAPEDHPGRGRAPARRGRTCSTRSRSWSVGSSCSRTSRRCGAYYDYRRWAFESAALDLALRQAGRSLADAVERKAGPVGSSCRWASAIRRAWARVRGWLEPIQACSSSSTRGARDENLVAELAELGCVESSTSRVSTAARSVDQPPDPRLYRLLVEGFPEAFIEDPALTAETRDPGAASRPRHLGRDHPLGRGHRGAALPAPDDQHQAVAVRERCGGCSTRTTTARSRESGRTAAASSSSALGAARSSTSPRSSIPTRPTTSRPRDFNLPQPRPGLPTSPLEPALEPTGFRWAEA